MVFSPRQLNNTSAAKAVTPGRRLFALLVLGSLAATVASYLAFTNAVATKGYEIRELQQRLAEIKVTTQNLEAAAAQRQALVAPPDAELPEGYMAVERIEYLASTPQVGVAVK